MEAGADEKEERRLRVEAMMRAMGLAVTTRDPRTSPSSLSKELEAIELEKKQLELEMKELDSSLMPTEADPVALLTSTAAGLIGSVGYSPPHCQPATSSGGEASAGLSYGDGKGDTGAVVKGDGRAPLAENSRSESEPAFDGAKRDEASLGPGSNLEAVEEGGGVAKEALVVPSSANDAVATPSLEGASGVLPSSAPAGGIDDPVSKGKPGRARSRSDPKVPTAATPSPVASTLPISSVLPSAVSIQRGSGSKTVDLASLFVMNRVRPKDVRVRVEVAGHRAPRDVDGARSFSKGGLTKKRLSADYTWNKLQGSTRLISGVGAKNEGTLKRSGEERGKLEKEKVAADADKCPSPAPVQNSSEIVLSRLQALRSADECDIRRALVELKRGVSSEEYVKVLVSLDGISFLQNVILSKSQEEKISRSVLGIALDVLLAVISKNTNWSLVKRSLLSVMVPLISVDIMTVKTRALEVMSLMVGSPNFQDFDADDVDNLFRGLAEAFEMAPYEDVANLLFENNNASVVALEFLNNYLGRLSDDQRDAVLNALTDLNTDPAIAEMVRTSGDERVRKEAHRFQAFRMTELLATVQPYDKENEYHEEMLMDLWETVFPDEELESRVSSQWQRLGFQGKDPATDFRGMGLLGLHTLRHYALSDPVGFTAILESQRARTGGYPVAVGGINITHMLYQLMMIGAKPADRPLFVFLLDDSYAFEIIFAAMLELFNEAFIMVDAGYMDFPNVFSGIEGRVQGILEINPSSLVEFLSLVDETKKLKLKLEEMSVARKTKGGSVPPPAHLGSSGKHLSGRLIKRREQDKAREYGSTIKHLREVLEDRESVKTRQKKAGVVNRQQEKAVIASSVAAKMEGLAKSETLSITVKNCAGKSVTIDIPRAQPVSDVTTLCLSTGLCDRETGEEVMKTSAGQFMMPYLPVTHYIPESPSKTDLTFFFGLADELEELHDREMVE